MPGVGFFNASRGVLFGYEHKNFDWLWQSAEPHGTTEVVSASGESRSAAGEAAMRARTLADPATPVYTWGKHPPQKSGCRK